MLNPVAFQQALHMILAAYAATGFAVAGIHAFLLLFDRQNAFHRRALGIALLVGGPAAVLQPLSGDLSARAVAEYQPAKLAAMESLLRDPSSRAARDRRVARRGGESDALRDRDPGGLSFLAFHDASAEVQGLDDFPAPRLAARPDVHAAFQLMVALGTYLALVAGWAGVLAVRRQDLCATSWLLRALAIAAPMGFIAIEAGWTVTEVGRQPWIIYEVLRTADAVTPMPGLIVPFLGFTLLYCFLGAIVAWLLYRQIIRSPRPAEWSRIYAPREPRVPDSRSPQRWPPRWPARSTPTSSSAARISAAACGTSSPPVRDRPASARSSAMPSGRSGKPTTSG